MVLSTLGGLRSVNDFAVLYMLENVQRTPEALKVSLIMLHGCEPAVMRRIYEHKRMQASCDDPCLPGINSLLSCAAGNGTC